MHRRLKLEIYTEVDCPTYATSLNLAVGVRKRFPTLSVGVIELSSCTGPIPETVFAVPTYLLDGKTIFLGNPDQVELCKRIEEELNHHNGVGVEGRDDEKRENRISHKDGCLSGFVEKRG